MGALMGKPVLLDVAFHQERVRNFIAKCGNPDDSAIARVYFNDWAGPGGEGGIFSDYMSSPSRDYWDRWKELVDG